MKVVEFPQGTDEWLAARCGIPTASCFADVMAKIKSGESADRRNYRAKLVVERLTGKPVQTFLNDAMKLGTEREPLARLAYEARTGNLVQEIGLCLHDELECGASPDGLIDADGGLEIKCPGLAKHLEYLKLPSNTAPSEYVWQVQGCMAITGRKWWDFVSFNPDFPEALQLTIRRIQRDDVAIDKLFLELAVFVQEVKDETEFIRKLPLAA